MSYQTQYFSRERRRKFKVIPNLVSNKGANLNELVLIGDFGGDDVGGGGGFQCDEIKMFGGDVEGKFPSGIGVDEWEDWFLCNGQSTPNGNTLDLRKKFIAGLDDNIVENEYSSIGNTGGENEVTLTADQSGLPSHSHQIIPPAVTPTEGGIEPKLFYYNAEPSEIAWQTELTGNQDALTPHENRPEFVVVAFVQYKGTCPVAT